MRVKSVIQMAALVAAMVLLSGCTMMTIKNTSTVDIHILVNPPDSASSSFYLLKAGDAKAIDSQFGGSFSVTALPDLGFLTTLQDQKEKIEAQIVIEDLSVEQVKRGRAEVLRLQRLIEAEKLNAGSKAASCSGTVQDFGSVSASVNLATGSNSPSATCTVENPKSENSLLWAILDILIGASRSE